MSKPRDTISASIRAAAANGIGFRCAYNSGSNRMPKRLTTDAAFRPAL